MKMVKKEYDYNGLFIGIKDNIMYLIEAYESENLVECDDCPKKDTCISFTNSLLDDKRYTPGSVSYTIYEILYDSKCVERALFAIDGGIFGYCENTDENDFINWLKETHKMNISKYTGDIDKMRWLLDECVVA